MAFLSNGRIFDDASGTYCEELSFFGSTREETQAEMQRWIMRTMPVGTSTIAIQVKHLPQTGSQYRINVSYACQQQAEDRVEPTGLLSSTELP